MVEEKGDRFRDTMAATLRSDGSFLEPFYIKAQYKTASKASGRRADPSAALVRGMNNANMKAYVDHIDAQVEEPSRLLLDRLSSHKAKAILTYIEAKRCQDGRQKFKPLLLPPKGAILISPPDNSFFAYWKAKFYTFDRSTFELKMLAAKETWASVDPEIVESFFRGCHLLGMQREETLRRELLALVDPEIPVELQPHAEYYEAWLNGAFQVDGISAPRAVPLERATIPEDSALDGVYWREWGAHGKES